MRSVTACLASLAALMMLQGLALAQPSWTPPEEGRSGIALEVLRPSLEGVDRSFLSSAYFLSGRYALSQRAHLVAEIPYASFNATLSSTDVDGNVITIDQSGSTFGNPYLGVVLSSGDSPIFGELGVRAPVADVDESEARAVGLFADATRWEGFLPKAVFVQGAFNLHEVTVSKLEYRLRVGPSLVIATDDRYWNDGAELFGVYGWSVGYHGDQVRIGTGISGRILFTEDFGNLGERSVNQLDLHADVGSWSVRPGLDVHVPLGELANDVPVVVGAHVSWVR